MDAKQNLYELEMECFEIFKAQNPDDFDVAFEIDEKKLYADKYKLSKCSPTFKSMFSELWLKSESIKIETYGYENFKEFITFIYSGECKLSNENIFEMVDIAEFYGVAIFKKACDKFISEMEFTLQNAFQILQFANKYSLIQLKESLNAFISKNLRTFLKCEDFLRLEKSMMKDVVQSTHDALMFEELFETVYKWAETRALKKQETNGSLNLNDAIKEDLIDIVPLFKFEEMDFDFLIKFVVKKSFLFSGEKLSEVLWAARGKVYVKIFDENGKISKGLLNCPDMNIVADVIHSVKNSCASYWQGYWDTKQTKPSEPSKITKNDRVEWYLVYDNVGDLTLRQRNNFGDDDYILAEMFAEDGFVFNEKCKIEVYRYV